MGVNKVVFGAVSIMDISDSTVTADTLAKGKTAYDKKGDKITGTMESGIDTSDATAVASEILSGKTAYAKGSKVTGTMSTQTLPTPSISVSSGGLITATDKLSASGYVVNGTKSATKQLTTQGAKTWTPSTTNQTIASGRYLTGTQTIKGDGNLVASNIKSGVSIFGVTGSYEGSGGGDSVETCTVRVNNNTGYSFDIYYIDANGDFANDSDDDIICRNNTLVVIQQDEPLTSFNTQNVANRRVIDIDRFTAILHISNPSGGIATITIGGGGGGDVPDPDVPDPI